MKTNGHIAPESRLPAVTSLSSPEIVEFSLPLHVAKKCGRGDEDDTYSLYLWQGTVLSTLCVSESLETAMSFIQRQIQNAGARMKPELSDRLPVEKREV